MNSTSILSHDEIMTVLDDLRRRATRSRNAHVNLIIFRLACCCGLRRKEIGGLQWRDVVVGGPRPVIRIRKDNTKGIPEKRRARLVPLWWDAGTLRDLTEWLAVTRAGKNYPHAPFIFGQTRGKLMAQIATRIPDRQISKKWLTAIRALGPDRVRQLSVHKGRHSFVSHALHAGHSLVAVKEAAGHASISSTSIYCHLLDEPNIVDLFERKLA